MDKLKILQKDPLWGKSCEVSQLLISVVSALNMDECRAEVGILEKYLKEVPVDIAKGIIATNAQDQMHLYTDVLVKARGIDTALHRVFECVNELAKVSNKDKVLGEIFLTFIAADQLREMILNAQNDIELLKMNS